MLIHALLLSGAVHAADLDLTIQFGEADPVSVTFKDVAGIDLPSLLIEDEQGSQRVVSVAVDVVRDDQYRVIVDLMRVEYDRRGRMTLELESSPRITVHEGVPATIEQGQRIPHIDGDTVTLETRSLHIEAVVRE